MAGKSRGRAVLVFGLAVGGVIALLSAAATLNRSHVFTGHVIVQVVLGGAAVVCATALNRSR